MSVLLDATRGLAQTAPDLLDALHQAVEPMRTFAETRGQLASLLSGADYTVGTTRQSFDNHIDQLVRITADFTPVLGVLAQKSNNFVPAVTKLDNLANQFMEQVWNPQTNLGNMRAMLTFTPSSTYTRADCPHYGELKRPSCFTAPLIPVRPDLPDVLLPQNYQPPKDLAPPPGTVIGPDGNHVAVCPPLINPTPNLTDPNPPTGPGDHLVAAGAGERQSGQPVTGGASDTATAATVGRAGGAQGPVDSPVLVPAVVRRQRGSREEPIRTNHAGCDHRWTRVGGDRVAAGSRGPRNAVSLAHPPGEGK